MSKNKAEVLLRGCPPQTREELILLNQYLRWDLQLRVALLAGVATADEIARGEVGAARVFDVRSDRPNPLRRKKITRVPLWLN